MQTSRLTLSLCLAAALAGCGGGGSSGAPSGGTPTPTAPTPAPTVAACSLSQRQDWALGQLNEWYLFPDLMAAVNKGSYSNLSDYVDAIVAPARAQNKDRYFTYVTSIAEENAYYQQGTTAGFGLRFELDPINRRLFVTEAFEGGPGLAAGVDRGAEIVQVGTSASNLQSVSNLLTTGGTAALVNALGPDTPGTARVLVINTPGIGTRTVTVTKADFALDPVSDRYGAKIITDGARKVGYVNLRTFINTAEPDLIAAFANFKAQGVTELIIDLRYNGGGLIDIGLLLDDLMAADKANQVSGYMTFRASKSGENETFRFEPPAQAIAATKIAFIGTGGTASASELVMNSFPPYLGNNVALVGSNTYGKPVGQIAEDLTACDDRLRIIAFKLENANHQGEYFNGLATTMPVTCRASDDIGRQLGDPQEPMIATALTWLAGGSCSAITAAARTTQAAGGREPLQSERPSAAQRETPGLF